MDSNNPAGSAGGVGLYSFLEALAGNLLVSEEPIYELSMHEIAARHHPFVAFLGLLRRQAFMVERRK